MSPACEVEVVAGVSPLVGKARWESPVCGDSAQRPSQKKGHHSGHQQTHTLTQSLTYSLLLSYSLSLSHARSHSLSHSFTLWLSRSLSLSLTLSLLHSLTLSLPPSPSLTLSHSLSLTLTLSLSHSPSGTLRAQRSVARTLCHVCHVHWCAANSQKQWFLSRLVRLCARSFLVAPSVRNEDVVANLLFFSQMLILGRELRGLSRVHLRDDFVRLEDYVCSAGAILGRPPVSDLSTVLRLFGSQLQRQFCIDYGWFEPYLL